MLYKFNTELNPKSSSAEFQFFSAEFQGQQADGKCAVAGITAVLCMVKMKASGKQVFLSFWAFNHLYSY